MAFRNAAGAVLSRTQVIALTTAQGNPPLTVNSDVYEDTVEAGSNRTQSRKRWAVGETIRQSDIDAEYPVPTLTAVAPANGPAAGGTAVTLTGSGFEAGFETLDDVEPVPGADVAGVTVTFGGVAATSVVVVSDTEITCVAPANPVGAVAVAVVTSAASASLAGAFTYA